MNPIVAALSPCPMCSNRGAIFRPSWIYADWTSRKRSVDHWLWFGCTHYKPAVGPVDNEGRAKIEAGWALEVPALFAQRTERYTEEQREIFARLLAPPPFELEYVRQEA